MTDKDIEVIVKPIFTKMFKANFSACEYGIECYKKGMEYQGIKELAIENDNLIKRNTKLEQENETLSQNLDDAMSVENCLKKRIAELEATNKKISDECHKLVDSLEKEQKENAELKLKLEALEGQTPWKDIKDKSEVIGQLTKAKEIIKKLKALYFSPVVTKDDVKKQDEILNEAEQFLKDLEVK